ERKRLITTTPGSEPGSVDVSPDGTMLAACPDLAANIDSSGPRIRLWDLRDGKPLKVPKVAPGFNQVLFTPDGKTLLASSRPSETRTGFISTSQRQEKG